MNVVDAVLAAVEKRSVMVSQLNGRTTAYRLIHSAGDDLYGLTADVLGDILLVEQHREEVAPEPLVDALAKIFPDRAIFLKQRWSRESTARCGAQVRGEPVIPNFEIFENELRFGLRLLDEEHVGLFLDSRLTREWVQSNSAKKRVLNLFSYTGGFGVYAAAGGALSTVNIDNKNSALYNAQNNYQRNQLPFDNRTFFKCDVLYYLKRGAKQKGRFDLIVVDPPPRFKRRRQGDFLAHRDYGKLLSGCIHLLAPTGQILAGLNSLKADDGRMDEIVQATAAATNTSIKVCELLQAHADFPSTPDRPTARFKLLHVSKD